MKRSQCDRSIWRNPSHEGSERVLAGARIALNVVRGKISQSGSTDALFVTMGERSECLKSTSPKAMNNVPSFGKGIEYWIDRIEVG